ncbi:MAG TPA: hypothetical protein VGE62_02075 [Candidatus Paceibacterota bacterium]
MDASSSGEINGLILLALKLAYLFIIVTLPIYLAQAFWENWVKYVRAAFFAKQKYVTLELRIPKGITKSPLAMEVFITSLFQPGGEGDNITKYWEGSVRSWFSLEIVSIDGSVRFFIWSKEKFKDMIETQLYSQFPDIEILDVTDKDYAKTTPFDPENYQYWGCEFVKTGPSHLPIKTYTDYGLADDQKEEYKVDPITPVLEFLGSLRKGEQAWIQICIRAHGKDKTKPGTWFEKVDWKFDANEDIKKRTKRDVKIDKEKPMNPNLMQLTKGERDAVDAIERSLSKIPFDCGIRAIYVAKANSFRGTTQAAISGAFRQFGSQNLNGFKADKAPGVKYPWQDRSGQQVLGQKKKLFNRYKARAFFYDEFIPVGYKGSTFVMNTEELATVYHFPGDVSKTPTLSRVVAKKVEPPANLPI